MMQAVSPTILNFTQQQTNRTVLQNPRQYNTPTRTYHLNNRKPQSQYVQENTTQNRHFIPTARTPTHQSVHHHSNIMYQHMPPPYPRQQQNHNNQQPRLQRGLHMAQTSENRQFIQNIRVPVSAGRRSHQDDFDTIPDDVFMSIKIPQSEENNRQKRRKVVRNPYKK